MSWTKYTLTELRLIAKRHNEIVKIPDVSKLKREQLVKYLNKHFEFINDKLHHKSTGKIVIMEEREPPPKKEKKEKKEEPKKVKK